MSSSSSDSSVCAVVPCRFALIAALAVLMAASAASPLFAQQWAQKMFEEKYHDFGTVARGAKAQHRFVLENPYVEDVHIASVRSSCGCTDVAIEQSTLKTYEEGAIVATINSDRFLGAKGSTITVRFDKPYAAEVQLQVKSFIRSDVVFHPGSVQLGTIDAGTPLERSVEVDYAGRSDWRILDVRSNNPHIQAEAIEKSRAGGRVTYDLVVHVDDDLPPGYVQEHLVLVTNDHSRTEVPVLVEGRLDSGLTISPSTLFIGSLKPGESVTRQFVVRGKRPFRITSIGCDDDQFNFEVETDGLPKPLHIVPITFTAGAEPGKVNPNIQIETDLGITAPEISAYAVVESTAAASTEPADNGSTTAVQ